MNSRRLKRLARSRRATVNNFWLENWDSGTYRDRAGIIGAQGVRFAAGNWDLRPETRILDAPVCWSSGTSLDHRRGAKLFLEACFSTAYKMSKPSNHRRERHRMPITRSRICNSEYQRQTATALDLYQENIMQKYDCFMTIVQLSSFNFSVHSTHSMNSSAKNGAKFPIFSTADTRSEGWAGVTQANGMCLLAEPIMP